MLQDYGAAVPAEEPARQSRFRAVSLVAVAAIAMALLVMAVSNGGAEKIELSQHLMSQFSGSDDSTQSLSSSSGSGSHWYGHWSDSDSSSADSQPNWMKQLKTMQARAAARRARENKEFFSGVSKAFGNISSPFVSLLDT